jgi:hypothetical protein
MAEGALIAFFTGWILLTIAYQFEPKILLRYDFKGFVPSCRFFAPMPMSTDPGFYYCTVDEPEGDIGGAIWGNLMPIRKRLIRPVWNPEQRLEKTLTIILEQLIVLKRQGARIEFSLPYLRLLNIASSKANARAPSRVRFRVTTHRGWEEPSRFIVLDSRSHACD